MSRPLKRTFRYRKAKTRSPLSDTAALLHQSVTEGNYEATKKLLDDKQVDFSEFPFHRTPLTLAAHHGYEDIIELLLAAGADPNLGCRIHKSKPLWRAIDRGHQKAVKALLKADGIKLDLGEGHTPLHVAVTAGHEEIAELILNNDNISPNAKCCHGMTALEYAINGGHGTIAELLVENTDIDQNLLGRCLCVAVKCRNEKIVKLLLGKGVDPNSQEDAHGRTPLCLAAINDHEAVAKLLLTSGADPNLAYRSSWQSSQVEYKGERKREMLWLDCDESAPLYGATREGKGINSLTEINHEDGTTPLELSARYGYEKIVMLLLQSQTLHLTSGPTSQYERAISLAAKHGHKDVLKSLIDNTNVDTNSRSQGGRSALWWAVDNGHTAIVELLLNTENVDVDLPDVLSQRTPLSVAVRNGYTKISKLLLDSHKVNVDSKDVYGVSPLWWANQNRSRPVRDARLPMYKFDFMIKINDEGLLRDRERDCRSTIEKFFTGKNIHLNPEADIRLEIDYLCLAHWLELCDQRHSGCRQNKPVKDPTCHHGPQWVIDTENACIIPGRDISKYATLSYVWNQENEELSEEKMVFLNESNVFQLQTTQYLDLVKDALPQVIKDAIIIVKKLGVRYIWIDRLCIIQDSPDIQKEVDNMDEIYSGAYLTIIAATSSGLFSVPAHGAKRKTHRHSTDRKTYTQYLYESVLRTKWASRGWTFGEHILSNRVVIFVDGDMFWDCQLSLWDKDELIPGCKEYKDLGPSFEKATTHWPNFAKYIEMVCLYNYRVLTYPQDALAAISGVLNISARGFISGFVSGLPRLCLDFALLWQPYSKARRRYAKQKPYNVEPKDCLPSWSWCGWECPIDPLSLRTGLAYLGNEDCQSRASSWRTQSLVKWSVLSEDMQIKQQMTEPSLWKAFEDLSMEEDAVLPDGWSRHAKSDGGDIYFEHTSVPTIQFKHIVPISNVEPSKSSLQKLWPFLSCRTTRNFFIIGAILNPDREDSRGDSLKTIEVSVFDLDRFLEAPTFKGMCNVICLDDSHGRFAGHLRVMDDALVAIGEQIELIAISSGSVSFRDLKESYEEKVDKRGYFRFKNRKVYFTRTTSKSDDPKGMFIHHNPKSQRQNTESL